MTLSFENSFRVSQYARSPICQLINIENARPETIKAPKPRIDPKKVPFDPRETIKQVPEWDNLDRGWGTGN